MGSELEDAVSVGVEIGDWLSPTSRISAARAIEEHGFRECYMAEIGDPDVFVTSALALSATSTLRMTPCVVQLGPRSVPMIASSASTIASIFPGRFSLAVGVSSKAIVEGWHGRTWTNPLSRAEESVELLRRLLAGESSDLAGVEVQSKGFRLSFPPEATVPVQLAALNEKMLKLAARMADGVWLNFVSRDHLKRVVTVIHDAADSANRPRPEILLSVPCFITDDPAAERARMRQILRFYMHSPAYRRAFSWFGFAAEMESAQAAIAVRDKERLNQAITDPLVDSIALIGTASQVKDHINEYFDAGISQLSVGPNDDAALQAIFDHLSPGAEHRA